MEPSHGVGVPRMATRGFVRFLNRLDPCPSICGAWRPWHPDRRPTRDGGGAGHRRRRGGVRADHASPSRRHDPGLLRDLRRPRHRRRGGAGGLADRLAQARHLRDPDRLRPWLVSVAATEAASCSRAGIAGRSSSWRWRTRAARHRPGEPRGDLDLTNALARLDPDDRTLLALRYDAGFDSPSSPGDRTVPVGDASEPRAPS